MAGVQPKELTPSGIFSQLISIDSTRSKYIRNSGSNSGEENEALWLRAIKEMSQAWQAIGADPNISRKLAEIIEEEARAMYNRSQELQRYKSERGMQLARESFQWSPPMGISTDPDFAAKQVRGDMDEIGRLLPLLFEAI